MSEKVKESAEKIKQTEDDKPDYQEKITFLVSTVAQLFGIDIPDQPRVDSTFAAGLLGNILGGLGISVNAAQGAKKKKKEEENGAIANNGSGYQTIIIKQPIELITNKPDVVQVESNQTKKL